MTTNIRIPATRDKIESIRADLLANGFNVSGDHGTVTYQNILFEYHYDGSTLTLAVLCKPFYVSMEMIRSRITEWTGINPY